MIRIQIQPATDGDWVPDDVPSIWAINQLSLNLIEISTGETSATIEVNLVEFLKCLSDLLRARPGPAEISTRMTFSGDKFSGSVDGDAVALRLYDIPSRQSRDVRLTSAEAIALHSSLYDYASALLTERGGSLERVPDASLLRIT